MDREPIVVVENVSHAFDGKVVLQDVGLQVWPGEIVAVMGSSGGGKTTLLRCITGLLRPDSGSVHVAGLDVLKDPDTARRQMGMVFQSAALFDYLDVTENVVFAARRWKRLARGDLDRLAKETLAMVGLGDAGPLMPDELSGGMKKRVGIARALAMQPTVMLYDEPTTGLDPITAYTIDQLIVRLRGSLGVTSIVVSHDVSSVMRVADRIAFLESGRLTFVGTVEEFRTTKADAIRELVQKSEATSFD